jgi:hypothetical protein
MADPERNNNAAAKDEGITLPPVQPPATRAPAVLNQQVNVYQLPPSVWDKLSGDQVFELSKSILAQMEIADERNFNFATTDAQRSASGKKLSVICGSATAIIGFGLAAYLGSQGHDILAACIALPIGTILAVVVGNRFLG